MSGAEESNAEAALAVSTASLGGVHKPDLPMDLRVLAEAAIDRIAESNRKRPSLSAHTSADAPKFDFEKSVAKAKENSWEAVAQAFPLAAEATRAAFVNLARRQTNAVNAIDKFLRIQDEELQMLWWLVGQRSFDLDRTFDSVAADIQPLVFAKELADSTEILPGPASVKALLSRAGLKERKKIALSSVVNAADTAWLKTIVPEGEPSPVTTPIHFGIKRQIETGAGDTWIAGWAAAIAAPADIAMTPLSLGLAFYRERLLLLFGDG
jgi:hypothetical protein